MASIAINGGTTFPEGTSVSVYLRSQWGVEGITGAPSGSAVAGPATITSGVAIFTGLSDGTEYIAYASSTGRFKRFRTDPVAAGGYQKDYGLAGTVTTGVGGMRLRFAQPATVVSVAVTAGTAPTGAALIVDVNKNGTTIFTTQANRPSVAAGANVSADAVPDVVALGAGDYLTVDVDQVGSTIPGGDVTVSVAYR